MASNNVDSKPPPQDAPPEAAPGGGMPPPPAGHGPGMAYGGYQPYPTQPAYTFPPQPMMPYPMPFGGGMPMAPPHLYGAPPRAVPPSAKPAATQVCTVHPRGMPRAFDVPFPEKRLPVCDRCKKNYRSRELCRQRDGHKALPWQTTFLVMTIADELLTAKEEGDALSIADVPMIAELQETPELCRGPADGSMRGEPICPVCKEKNYTRDHCRNTLKHSTPPYQSIYLKLVPKKDADDVVPPPRKKKRKPEKNADGKPKSDPEKPGEEVKDESSDLTKIHESKTFFAKVSSKNVILKWCEEIRYPKVAPRAVHAAPGGYNAMPHAVPVNNPNFQYQLWDAFRAGAHWVQSGGQMHGGHMAPGYPPMHPAYGQNGKPPVYGNEAKPSGYGQDAKPPPAAGQDTSLT